MSSKAAQQPSIPSPSYTPRGNTRGSPQDPNTNLPPPDAAWKSNNPLNTRKSHRLRITEYQTGIARPAHPGMDRLQISLRPGSRCRPRRDGDGPSYQDGNMNS